MKKTIASILGVYLALAVNMAGADQNTDGDWQQVLSCDGGAAAIYNHAGYTRGAAGRHIKIVIIDMAILRYFNQSGAIKSWLLDTQWVGLGPTTNESIAIPTYSFALATPLDDSLSSNPPGFVPQTSTVSYDGTGVSVQLHSAGGDANWYFRTCTPTPGA